jgi:hypothetical protein
MWSALSKTHKRVVTERYSPCDNTPTAATAPVTTVDIALLICKNVLVHRLYFEVRNYSILSFW